MNLTHMFFSYCKSHIYELHALLSATITFLLMFPIKKCIKKWTNTFVKERAQKDAHWRENSVLYLKRMNMLVLLTAVILSIVVFSIVAYFSPIIHYSMFTAVLSAAFSLSEYALFEQLFGNERKEI